MDTSNYISTVKIYNECPNICLSCGGPILCDLDGPRLSIIKKKKYCNSSCAAKINNKLYPKRPSEKGLNFCEWCGNIVRKSFCSPTCAKHYEHHIYLNKWYLGLVSGGTGENQDVLVKGLRRHLIKKVHNKCELCGWGKINPYSNTYPLIIDHVDGNPRNHSPQNLRVICPNCDCLLPTFKGLNQGHGRKSRYK